MNNSNNILSLLPYNEYSELINKSQKLDDLYFIKSVIDICLMALDNFIRGNLDMFDAQVGENLCQIRACKILYLRKKYLSSQKQINFFKEIERLKQFKNKLEAVIIHWEDSIAHSFSYNKNLDAREYVHGFLERHDLYLDLKEDYIFIICCFFLSHFSVRNEGIPVAINLNFISRELHISKYRSKRLSHKHQLVVCKLGCDFVMSISNNLPFEWGYSHILPKLYQISDEDRAVLPCHIASEIVFYNVIKTRKPVLFIINRTNVNNETLETVYFLLIGHKKEFNFILVGIEKYLLDYCMVVSGVMHVSEHSHDNSLNRCVEHVMSETPLKLILANTASHPQYSGKRLELFSANPLLIINDEYDHDIKINYEEKLLNMQHFAKNGCSIDNQSIFFLKHIYASRVVDELGRLKKMSNQRIYNAQSIS